MNEQEMGDVFVNPYYAINISPSLFDKHEPLATKDKWIKANLKLMDEIGEEEWLIRLLSVLESGGITKENFK